MTRCTCRDGALEVAAKLDEMQEVLTLIERIYYMEGRAATWRAAQMNGVARDAQNGVDLATIRSRLRRAAPKGEK